MKVLIINGSHRCGNTDVIISRVTAMFTAKNIKTRILNLRDIDIKLPDGCDVCAESGICPNIKDQFSEEVEPTIRDFDIYIIASPTWSDGVTPLTKIFWDRIVSWCSDDRKYLRNKKLAVITHGMADESSWVNVINWVKRVCTWEECNFAGSLSFKSHGNVGSVRIDDTKIRQFITSMIQL